MVCNVGLLHRYLKFLVNDSSYYVVIFIDTLEICENKHWTEYVYNDIISPTI